MMKHFFTVKASLFTLILALVAVGTIAAAAVMIKKTPVEVIPSIKLENETWYFQGTDSPSNVTNPNLYADSPHPTKSCGVPQTICSIDAPEDPLNPGHPKMDELVSGTETVAHRIEAALANSKTENETVTAFREY
ncbi:hypothetical protein EDF66_11593 [Sphingobacterium sp. JUb20]|nr:hypothetical protein EDF66_11593 [Sphingobacterium sp. JUb20]